MESALRVEREERHAAMRKSIYVLGTTVLFALLGYWAGQFNQEPGWTALLGAAVGWGLGASCVRFLPAK